MKYGWHSTSVRIWDSAIGNHRESAKYRCYYPYTRMTNVGTLEGLTAMVLVFICSCALIKRVRPIRGILTWRQFGPLSIFHKASVIGIRLKKQIAAACIVLAIYIIIKWHVTTLHASSSEFYSFEGISSKNAFLPRWKSPPVKKKILLSDWRI